MQIKNLDKELKDYSGKARQVAGMTLLLAIITALIILVGYPQYTSSGLYRRNYEGKVREKSLSGQESRYGSKMSYRLLIDSKEGERFEVIVGEQLYNRVETSDWVKSDQDGVSVSKAGTKGNNEISGREVN